MSAATVRAVLLAALALAGCGVKAAPRPPLRPSQEPAERRSSAGAPAPAEACACDLADPSLAGTARRP